MQELKDRFDDITEDNDGAWSQICSHCVNEMIIPPDLLHDIPLDGLICGVKDCENEAEYYIDFK